MLTVFEIYPSIQGESTHAGRPCVFVRLAACDLRCSWCDTPYAFTGGQKMDVDEVLARVAASGIPLVELTGGEPLLQKEAIPLMARLVEAGHEVLLETGGHLSVADVPAPVVRIVDVKCPGSGEADRNHWDNLTLVGFDDEVKFVIKDRGDYEYARQAIADHALPGRVRAVHFSPVHGVLEPRLLAEWVIADRLPVRVQLQLHKYIWSPATRGV
jgi:7-carboxy-7-deazaguanine synthase